MEGNSRKELHAVVDMGSNGIRFSITDLSAPMARILPTVYQDRAAISLHDGQFRQGSDSRHPIPQNVQDEVIAHILRFKRTCLDLGVPQSDSAVVATEATRLAPNSWEFMTNIQRATGWDAQVLSQEEEGLLGAWGVVSSLPNVEGLVIDLGGGSMQISWVSKNRTRHLSVKGSIGLPYGAATLARRDMQAANSGQDALSDLAHEVRDNVQKACGALDIPEGAIQRGNMDLYLTGGGFRAWGHLLMNTSEQHSYPIPVINGFKTDIENFKERSSVTNILNAVNRGDQAFRISQRRAMQLPAVAKLVDAITQELPSIRNVWFCQGGIREGFFFSHLPPEITSQDPLFVATMPYRTSCNDTISSILQSAFPKAGELEADTPPTPPTLNVSFVTAFSNIMYAHSGVPKDNRPSTALRCTTTGLLASAHGLSHGDRALLALALYERWTGDLLPPDAEFLKSMRQIVSMEEVWWCRYLGRVAAAMAEVYPTGIIPATEVDPRISFKASMERKVRPKKGGIRAVRLVIEVDDRTFIRESAKRIEKLGKKKNWVKADERTKSTERDDWGLKVDIELVRK